MPEAVQKATNEYRKEQNIIGRFLEDETIKDENGIVFVENLYKKYETWCQLQPEQPVGVAKFGTEMVASGYGRTKQFGKRVYTGLKIIRGE